MTGERTRRLAPLTDPPAETQEILAKGLSWNGSPLNMPQTLAHHPKLLKRFTVFAATFLTHSVLPDRDRELLTLRAAARFGTPYYFGHHIETARAAGLTDAEIESAASGTDTFTGTDSLLIDLVAQLAEATDVDDELWTALAAHYDEAQCIEAVFLVGFYRMVAGFVNVARVEPEAGLPRWPPTA
jgi:4-carboxymuconolactone decarboxylase